MSLDIKDIERGVGADLLRRPIIISTVNAAILRFFAETLLDQHDDEEEDEDYVNEQFPQSRASARHRHEADKPRERRNKNRHNNNNTNNKNSKNSKNSSSAADATPEDAEGQMKSGAALEPSGKFSRGFVEHFGAALIFVVAHALTIIGLGETVVWFLCAIIFKAFKLPRIYAFEKLILDIRAIFLKDTLQYINKSVRFQCAPGHKMVQLSATRRGFGPVAITVITSAESLTRDTSALLRLLRYMNGSTISYSTADSIVMVGRNSEIVRALCNLGTQPVLIDLGWHKDVIENTNFKLSVTFTREMMQSYARHITSIGQRVICAEVIVGSTTADLELMVRSMDQFAAVCEASERGRRFFNGKRVSIYSIGLAVSVSLIVFYEGLAGLTKPSADVLTLAVGAYTLWMTIGKSAALGETEEETKLTTHTRDNILMAYHGLASIEPHVVNTCWVPEVFREDVEVPADATLEDGSISLQEAAVCLSIFQHFGHLVKWKGPRLVLDRLLVEEESDGEAGVKGIAHIVGMERLSSVMELKYEGEDSSIQRLGGSTRTRRPCKHARSRAWLRSMSVASSCRGSLCDTTV